MKEWLSLNQMIGVNRWKMATLKKLWKPKFKALILQKIAHSFDDYTIEFRYKSRMDMVNVVGGIKYFEDAIVDIGLVPNDDKRFGKGLTITPDMTLKHNTYILILKTFKKGTDNN